MADEPKIDAKWIGSGRHRTLSATVPLEHYDTAPSPFLDLLGFERWCEGLSNRLHEIADGKVSEYG